MRSGSTAIRLARLQEFAAIPGPRTVAQTMQLPIKIAYFMQSIALLGVFTCNDSWRYLDGNRAPVFNRNRCGAGSSAHDHLRKGDPVIASQRIGDVPGSGDIGGLEGSEDRDGARTDGDRSVH